MMTPQRAKAIEAIVDNYYELQKYNLSMGVFDTETGQVTEIETTLRNYLELAKLESDELAYGLGYGRTKENED